jgi:hypothetical protein
VALLNHLLRREIRYDDVSVKISSASFGELESEGSTAWKTKRPSSSTWGFTQFHQRGNDAAKHREQSHNEKHRSQKGGGRENQVSTRVRLQTIRTPTAARKNNNALRIKRARSVTGRVCVYNTSNNC